MTDRIEVHLVNHTRTRVPRALLERAVTRTLAHGKVNAAQVELHLAGDVRMRAWNKRYLKHDYTTDVLSFDLGQTPGAGHCTMLAVCVPYARREARHRSIRFEEELVRYVIHGMLHTLGYDDSDDASRAKMWKVQEKLVGQVL